jgi:AcrR family transcriptional regulator
MPRSGADARRRLQQAALELFSERGYEATTTAEIAARAGVTERTFFRHFPDKRDALFDGEDAFRTALGDRVLAAPEGASPMDAMLMAFRSVVQTIENNRALTEPRQAVIEKTPALQERVLTKTAGLTDALSRALSRRGVEPGLAQLAAQVGMAAFASATRAWFYEPELGLDAHVTRAFAELHALSSARSDLKPRGPGG